MSEATPATPTVAELLAAQKIVRLDKLTTRRIATGAVLMLAGFIIAAAGYVAIGKTADVSNTVVLWSTISLVATFVTVYGGWYMWRAKNFQSQPIIDNVARAKAVIKAATSAETPENQPAGN